MSLNRMALRAATVLTLTNYYRDPYPTIAGGRVFDSRLDPIQGASSPDDLVPSISVYTDDDNGSGLSTNNGGPPFRRSIQIALWLTIGMVGPANDQGQPTVVFPQTDAQLEAMLDLFEYQARFALFNLTNKWARLLSTFFLRVNSWNSTRFQAAQNIRIAARQINAVAEMTDDDIYLPVDELTSPLPANIQALLDEVQADGAPRGDVAATINMLREAQIPNQVVMPRLKRVWFAHTHPADPSGPIAPRPVFETADLNP